MDPSKQFGAGFGGSSLKNEMRPCHVCQKTVYPAEFVGASDKAFHKLCFRCITCNKPLKSTDYATMDDKFYCPPHYDQMVKAKML